MNNREVASLMRGIAPVIRGFVESATAPLVAEISVLEAREPIHGKDGKDGVDGKDAAPLSAEALAEHANVLVTRETAPLVGRIAALEAREPIHGEKGEPGKDADVAEIAALKADVAQQKVVIDDLVARAPVPGPKGDPGESIEGPKGKDASECYAPDAVAHLVAKSIALLAESPLQREPPVAATQPSARLRTIFERNDKNQIVGARQELED